MGNCLESNEELNIIGPGRYNLERKCQLGRLGESGRAGWGRAASSRRRPKAVPRLANASTGLRLTTPLNPFTSVGSTFSIQGSLASRYNYILPGGLLWSNIAFGQIFRTDLLTNPPPPLLASDDTTASVHLPVMMTFANPFNTPFRLLSLTVTNQQVTLRWESASGRQYHVDASSTLVAWFSLTTHLAATSSATTFTTNVGGGAVNFFRTDREP